MLLTTACPLDCPDTCSLSVTVADGRIVEVDAAPGNAITGGFICKKVKHHARRVYAPERVLTPLLRRGLKGSGDFEAVSWDLAIEHIGQRTRDAISAYGPNSVVPFLYGSSAPSTAQMLYQRLFHRMGASYVAPTICAATHESAYVATFGTMHSADPRDVVHARLVVVWGANPSVSNTHFPPLVAQAQRAGARLIVVDPRRTGMAKRADLHVALRPGTDTALALAVARDLATRGCLDDAFLAAHADGVEEFLAAAEPWTRDAAAAVSGVTPDVIRELADAIHETRPAYFRVGWGLERNRSGGSGCAAVFALPVLTGQFGSRGAGVLSSTSSASPLRIPWHPADRDGPPRRSFNMNTFGRTLCDDALDPPISVLFVAGSNFAATNPNQAAVLRGLARDDIFTVVHDQVLTDTARYADLVLPATTHFETDSIIDSYGSYVVQRARAVIAPVGESRSDNEVAAALAVALGYSAADFDADGVVEAALPDGSGADVVRELMPDGCVQFVDTFPERERAHLARLDGIKVPKYQTRADSDDYPLTLLTPATAKTVSSMFAEFDPADESVRMHAIDADARGLRDGDRVSVFNELGRLTTKVRVDADLQPGVAWMPKGMWCRSYPERVTANVLMPDSLSDLASGACFNDARVNVEPAPFDAAESAGGPAGAEPQ